MKVSASVTIKDKALKSVAGHHPWIFSGAIEEIPRDSEPGELVDIVDTGGRFLARGFINPNSQITVRILTFEDEIVDLDFLSSRISRAVSLRQRLPEYDLCSAWRLVYGEADFLPGLVVDNYAGYLNVQFHSVGWERIKPQLCETLMKVTGAHGVFDGSDPEMREREGLDCVNRTVAGAEPPADLTVSEFGRRMHVDMTNGQKSGLYLDQKLNHQSVLPNARGRRVLDVFSYSGAFGLAALEGGCSSLTCVEISGSAAGQIEKNLDVNGFDRSKVKIRTADAFDVLRDMVDAGEEYDLVILDPPAFCKRKAAVTKACRGYKDINRLACMLVSRDGTLVSCSCSRPVSDELFVRVLWQASIESGREANLLRYAGQSPDHPTLLTFPESKYLKCATLQVY